MPKLTGMRAFTIVWIGQVVSLIGSATVGFAIPIFVFTETGRATDLALLGVAFTLPLLLTSTVAGAIVDRYDRKLMMMLSDLAAGVTSIILLALVATDVFNFWMLIPLQIINGAFQSFQWPAYSAAISTMLPKAQYGRANGMLSLAETGSGIFAPVLGAALLGFVGLEGLLILDIITFTFAIGALLLVDIPNPKRTAEGEKARGNILSESAYGLKYILARPSLLGMQLVFLVGNFIHNFGNTVLSPYILLRTDNSAQVLGWVMSAGAVGGVVGGLLMSAWGGPKRRAYGVLFGWMYSAIVFAAMGLFNNIYVWMGLNFLSVLAVPIINGSNQALWQAKVEPDLQGRVFSIRRLIAWSTIPISPLLAAPLMDFFTEPAMTNPDSPLALLFGGLFGTTPGSGAALIITISSLIILIVPIIALFIPTVRNADLLLPDHDQDALPVEPGAADATTPAAEPAAPGD